MSLTRIPESAPASKTYLPTHTVVQQYGLTRYWLNKYIAPDAWLLNSEGEKVHPLWLKSTIEAAVVKRHQAKGAA